MRYVDLESLLARSGFADLVQAAEATGALVAAEQDPEERKRIIKSNSRRWKDFRSHLESLVGQKCWYTESWNHGTDDDVDHFRPKAGVVECPDHGGYWWLAFNWRNYRLSCHRANRLRTRDDGETHGKGEHFPLLDDAVRWMGPGELCAESPSLLDPANPADPPMLTYGIDGTAALHPAYEDEPDAVHRISASRIYLHLDWPAFVEDRAGLYGTIRSKIEKLDRLAPAAEIGDLQARQTLIDGAQELIRMTGPAMPYSRTAEAYLRVFRGRNWVQRYVLNNLGAVE